MEFALILIPLLLVVFGIINFGLIFSAQIVLNNAVRDAARYAVVKPLDGVPLTCATVANYARTIGAPVGATATDLAVTVTARNGSALCAIAAGTDTVTGSGSSPACSTSGTQPLRVSVAYTHRSLVPLVPPATSDLSAVGAFQCEYSPS